MAMSARPPETVSAYLAQLRLALKGAPAGLISDALADCEDHLRNEIAQNPNLTETQILASVVETYGTPEEIAEEYRDMETTISTPFPKQEIPEDRNFGFFNVVSDPRTYGALLYMLLSLATGIFYFTWVVTGLSLTLGLSILIFGLPFAVLFISTVRALSLVEGRLIESMLGVRMPRRPLYADRGKPFGARIKAMFVDPRTWSTLLYMVLKLPLGIIYFVFAVIGLTVPLAIAVSPITKATIGIGIINFDDMVIAPPLWALPLTLPIGIALLALTLHVARGIGQMQGQLAKHFL